MVQDKPIVSSNIDNKPFVVPDEGNDDDDDLTCFDDIKIDMSVVQEMVKHIGLPNVALSVQEQGTQDDTSKSFVKGNATSDETQQTHDHESETIDIILAHLMDNLSFIK